MNEYIRQLVRRRDLMLYLVSSGLRARHRNTILGYVWWLLDPLLNLAIYYFVVGVIFGKGGAGYVLHLIVALSVWRWFQATITTASRSVVSQLGIITQVYLPKVVFPFSSVLTELVNFVFSLVVVGFFVTVFGRFPGVELLWLPVIIGIQLLFMTALALPVAYMAVFVRDMDNLLGHLLRIWFYASPIIWRESTVSPKWQWLIALNPMSHFLSAYRDVLLNHTYPDLVALLFVAVPSVSIILIATWYYGRYEHRITKAL